MSEFKVLGELIHYCSKCKLDLNHRITLMNGAKPARVLCLTCQTERSYKDPAARMERAKRIVRQQPTAKQMGQARKSFEEDTWKSKLSDTSKTPKKYNINEEFEVDDHVYHPTFGRGLVVGFVGTDKVQIYFGGEVKLLKGKKKAPEAKPFFGF